MKFGPVNTFLVCDREQTSLTLYRRGLGRSRWDLEKKYEVAVGAVGHRTPRGLYTINSRVINPDWVMPVADWVPKELQGTVVKGGDPNNPLKARWLGVTDPEEGVGIHGTADDASIGSAASHGCIRMHVPDVVDLFPRVKLRTPIYII